MLCDGRGNPLHFTLTPGQTHESQAVVELIDDAHIAGFDENVLRPVKVAGDKGYRSDWIDGFLLQQDIEPVVPSKANEDRAARPVEFDREAYRRRNIIERLIGWLKESRRILTRFEKTASNYAGMIMLAFIHRYLRTMNR